MNIFTKNYDAADLGDLQRDVSEAFNRDLNPGAQALLTDEQNLPLGQVTVTITYAPPAPPIAAKPKKLVCLDFDGVLYPNLKYYGTSVLKGAPIQGALAFVLELKKSYDVVVHSARCEERAGQAAVQEFLNEFGFGVEVVKDKPHAFVYVDDRAIQFKGDFDRTLADISEFTQWQEKAKAWARVAGRYRAQRRR